MSNQKENVETPFMRYMLKYNDNIIGSLTDEKFKYFIVDKYYDSLYYIYNNVSNLGMTNQLSSDRFILPYFVPYFFANRDEDELGTKLVQKVMKNWHILGSEKTHFGFLVLLRHENSFWDVIKNESVDSVYKLINQNPRSFSDFLNIESERNKGIQEGGLYVNDVTKTKSIKQKLLSFSDSGVLLDSLNFGSFFLLDGVQLRSEIDPNFGIKSHKITGNFFKGKIIQNTPIETMQWELNKKGKFIKKKHEHKRGIVSISEQGYWIIKQME